MSIDSAPGTCSILEQTVNDDYSGLTIQVELRPEGGCSLKLRGAAFQFGNREIHFDAGGRHSGSGTRIDFVDANSPLPLKDARRH